MRPVIIARASACALPTRPRRGTKYAIDIPYNRNQPAKGSISRGSKPPARAMIVMKYTPRPITTSVVVNTISRTARAVCITLVVIRPANSSA